MCLYDCLSVFLFNCLGVHLTFSVCVYPSLYVSLYICQFICIYLSNFSILLSIFSVSLSLWISIPCVYLLISILYYYNSLSLYFRACINVYLCYYSYVFVFFAFASSYMNENNNKLPYVKSLQTIDTRRDWLVKLQRQGSKMRRRALEEKSNEQRQGNTHEDVIQEIYTTRLPRGAEPRDSLAASFRSARRHTRQADVSNGSDELTW